MIDSERPMQQLPARRRSGIMYARRSRMAWIFGSIVSLLIAVPLGMIVLGLIVASACALLSLPAVNARIYNFQLVTEAWLNRRLRRRHGALGPTKVSEILFDDEGKLSKIDSGKIAINFLPLDNDGQQYLSEVRIPDKGLHSFTILIDSWGEAAASDPQALQDHLEQFGAVQELLAARYGVGFRLSLFFVRVPADPTESMDWFEQHKVESDDQAVRELQANIEEAMSAIIEVSGSFLCGISLSMPRPKEWSRYKPERMPLEMILESNGWRFSQMLIDGLTDIGVHGARRPDPYETAILYRGSLDMMNLASLYRDWYMDRRFVGSRGFDTLKDSMVLAGGALPYPHEVVAKRNYLMVGDTYTKTMFVPSFKRRQVPAGYIQQLFQLPSELWAGITLLYETTDASNERLRSRLEIRSVGAKQRRRQRQGVQDRAEHADEEARIAEYDEALYFSGADTVDLHLLATVSASSPDELQRASDTLTNHFRSSVLPLRPIRGDVAQWEARLAALGLPVYN